jgi:hypothetical protein
MKRGFTYVILMLLVLLPISSVSAQKNRRIIRTQKVQKTTIQKNESEFGSTEAYSEGKGVYLKWQTVFENKVIGFLVYRISPKGKELASQSLIVGSYLQSHQLTNEGNSYNFYDENGDLNSTYVIESYNDNGRMIVSAPFSTKQVTDLATIAGNTNAELVSAAQNKTPILETNKPNFPKSLKAKTTATESLADINNHRIIMAMQGVKIGVKKDGFYRITRAELQAAGFDVNANPNQWQLFFEGVEMVMNVGGNGDYIEFLGTGIDELESDTRVYNLVVGAANGKRMGSEISRPQGSGLQSLGYFGSYIKQERIDYAGGILNGDAKNFFGTAVGSGGGTINFNLDSIYFAAGKSTMELRLQGLTQTSHQVSVTLNGEPLEPMTGNGYDSMFKEYSVPISYFREGSNTLQLADGSGSFVMFDSMEIKYFRFYQAQNNQLSFYTTLGRPSTVNGFTSPNIRVFNVTNPLEPKLVTNLEVVANGSNYGVAILAGPDKKFIAVEDTGVLSAASVVQNSPSTLATPSHTADLIIISHGNFITQANAWADYRRGQGFGVEVVNVEDIYDEFGFCVTSSNSIRGFLQYAKTNWQTPPRYVLLIGDSTYDGRNYKGFGNFNFVPSKFVDTIYTEVPSDEALVDFDNDGLSELAIGRIPVRTAQAATDALNKTIAFETTSAQGLTRGAIFASDLPNGYDFEGLSQRLADQLPANMTKVAVNRALPNAQTVLLGELNTGRYLVNYSGHGRADIWAADSFFGRNNVPSLTNMSNLSLFTMLTCLNGYFVQPSPAQESLSEKLLGSTTGGGVAVWSSTGLTTPDIQEVMATRFYQQIAVGNMPRLGDLIRDAKGTITGGRDVRMSWCLLGDPMLKVR